MSQTTTLMAPPAPGLAPRVVTHAKASKPYDASKPQEGGKLKRAYVVPGTGDGVTWSPVLRAVDAPHDGSFTLRFDERIKTVCEAVREAIASYPKRKCAGVRKPLNEDGTKVGGYVWRTYAEIGRRIQDFGAGAKHLNLLQFETEGKFKVIGLMGRNHPDWFTAEQGALWNRAATVPLYTTTAIETIVHSVTQNSCATFVCDPDCAKRLLEAKPRIPSLVNLVVYGYRAPALEKKQLPELKTQGEALGVKVYGFEEVLDAGKAHPSEFEMPKPSDVFSFCYTSGSSGMPKGVIITHEAQLSATSVIMSKLKAVPGLNFPYREQYHISYLPIAHVLERSSLITIMFTGGSAGFSQGIREAILDDIVQLGPTIFPTVPRLLNLFRDKILGKVEAAGGVKAKLFHAALNAKLAALERTGALKHPVWDALVFKKVRKSLGFHRLKLISTGSAPIAKDVLNFFRVVTGIPVLEGYGASELTFAVSILDPADTNASLNVGGPLACSEMCLMSVPEKNFLVTDREHDGQPVLGRGEICARGPIVMREYYRLPDATRKAVDEHGFYHTGDLGCVLPDGSFKIVGRVGQTIKLSNGEYATPEAVEVVATTAELVMQIYVYGDAHHPVLVGVVVPDPDRARRWAESNGTPDASLPDLCNNPDFKDDVLKQITAECVKAGLAKFQHPKVISLDPNPFTVDNILTPSFKIAREKAKAYYADQLAAMLGPAN